MQQSISGTQFEPRVRDWLPIVNAIFYVVLVAALGAFIYYLYTYFSLITLYLPFLLQAAALTLGLSLVSMVLAIILGLLGAFGRLSRFAVIRAIAYLYVEVMRGTPALVQLYLWYFGVGQLLSGLGFDPYNAAFNFMTILQSNSLVPLAFSAFFYGVIGLGFNYGAYLTEVFRSGIQSVDKGQSEAALSLGLNSGQTMRRIVLPQAIRITIPPFTNYFITLIQDTALLSAIGVGELEQTIGSFAYPLTDSNQKMFLFIFGALMYLAICYPLALLARYLESRFSKGYSH